MTVLLYAAILGFMQVALAFLVISRRWKYKVAKGDGDVPELRQAIRVHGNFAEYVPFIVLLMYLAEMSGAHALAIHALGLILLSGRLMHAKGLFTSSGPTRLRMFGMIFTFVAFLSSAFTCLLYYIF